MERFAISLLVAALLGLAFAATMPAFSTWEPASHQTTK